MVSSVKAASHPQESAGKPPKHAFCASTLGWEPPASGHGLPGGNQHRGLPDLSQNHWSLSGSRTDWVVVRLGPVNPAQATAASASVIAAARPSPLQ
jgi:hypothetical protein